MKNPGNNLTGFDRLPGVGYHAGMIEWGSFLFGLLFSFLVYFRSIRNANLSRLQKAFYFVITLIGITGTLFLSGVLIAHALRKFQLL